MVDIYRLFNKYNMDRQLYVHTDKYDKVVQENIILDRYRSNMIQKHMAWKSLMSETSDQSTMINFIGINLESRDKLLSRIMEFEKSLIGRFVRANEGTYNIKYTYIVLDGEIVVYRDNRSYTSCSDLFYCISGSGYFKYKYTILATKTIYSSDDDYLKIDLYMNFQDGFGRNLDEMYKNQISHVGWRSNEQRSKQQIIYLQNIFRLQRPQ